MAKLRRVDFYADDWIAGTLGLSFEERGVYITACALIYSRGGPIAPEHLRQACPGDGRVFNRVIRSLIDLGKLLSVDGLLTNSRCVAELQRAHSRALASAENGRSGGREPNKNNELENLAPRTRATPPSCDSQQEEDFKNLEGDVGRSAPAREGAREQAPPTEAEKAEVAAMVDQVKATLTGGAPKGIRDAEAYKATIADNKFRAVCRAVNDAAAVLDGPAREEAWRVVAVAQEAGAWAGMPRSDRRKLRELWQWQEALDEGAAAARSPPQKPPDQRRAQAG